MSRTLVPALAVALLGLAAADAHAATLDDKPATGDAVNVAADAGSDAAAAPVDDAANKKGRKGGQGGGAQAARGGAAGHAPAAAPTRAPAASPKVVHKAVGQGSGAHVPQRPAASAGQRSSGSQQASAQRSSSSAAHARPSSSSSASRSQASDHRRAAASNGHVQAHRDASTAHHTRAAEAAKKDHRSSSAAHRRPAGEAHHTRPGRTHKVHHARYAPARWIPAYHRYHIRNVPHYHPSYWAAGVFIYNPPPARHTVVVVEDHGGKTRKVDSDPSRAVDRNGDFGVGVTGGSYMSGYEGGGGYGDMGLGLSAQFRPHEAVGLEFEWSRHDQTWDEFTERVNNPTQVSVNLYAFPWTRVSPYLSAGLTWDHRAIDDTYFDGFQERTVQASDTLFGPHAGLGVEFALGENAAINFEADYIGYLNRDEADPTGPSALQGTMGLNFYF